MGRNLIREKQKFSAPKLKICFTPPFWSSIFIELQSYKRVKMSKKVVAYIIRAFADGLGSSHIKFIVSKLFYSVCFLLQNDYSHHYKLPSSRTLPTSTANIQYPL